MATEKITFPRIVQNVFKRKGTFKHYIFFILTILALSFVSIYLTYTTYSFFGALIVVALTMPLVIAFSEYSAIIESGTPFPLNLKTFTHLFRNTYRSGRIRLVFSWRTIIYFLLYIFVATFATSTLFGVLILLFDKPLFNEYMVLINNMVTSTSPEALNALFEELTQLFIPYVLPFTVLNHLIIIVGLIFVTNRAIFKIYASVFIEHQPKTKFQDVMDKFFSDAPTKKTMRRMNLLAVLIVSLIYSVVFAGFVALFYFLGTGERILLQAELVALPVLMVALPLATRFNFYFTQMLMAEKREAILRFTINELKTILLTTNLPEQSQMYIAEILKAREAELQRMTAVDDENAPPDDKNDELTEE